MKSNATAFLIKIKLRHSLGRPSRSDFVQAEFVAEGAAIPVYDSAGDFNEKTIESYKLASIVTLDGEDFLAYYGERKLIFRVAFERYLRNHPELRRRV